LKYGYKVKQMIKIIEKHYIKINVMREGIKKHKYNKIDLLLYDNC
jgi:hypothetical protein